MKTFIKALVVVIWLTIVMYLGVAFQQMKWNPMQWSSSARIGIGISFIIIHLLVGAMVLSKDDESTRNN